MLSDKAIPLVMWASEIRQTHNGHYIRVNTFIDDKTKESHLVIESAPNVSGPWKETTPVA
jgi:ribulose bisphosphate carboxylase small subunit